VNETLLRSIVTQPSNENYVYAYNFTALAQAKNLVVGSTCQTYVPDLTTTTTPLLSTTTVSSRAFNGKVVLNSIVRFYAFACTLPKCMSINGNLLDITDFIWS